jgi:hypothetical protein
MGRTRAPTLVPAPARATSGAAARTDAAQRAERPAEAAHVGHRFDALRVHADDPARAVPGAAPLLDEPGQPLDRQVGARIGAAYGRDFSGVRVHHGTPGAAVASRHSARAVTVGSDVAFAPGEYRPGTALGDALIAHELAHVVQQDGAAGAARAPAHGALEADADRAAASAVLAAQVQRPRGIMPALRTGLALQSCQGGARTPTVPEAIRIQDYERAAVLLAAEPDDGRIMDTLRPLTADQLGRLDAAAAHVLGAGADRIHRPVLFLLHGPAAGTAHDEVTVERAGTVRASGTVNGGDVEARTGVRFRANRSREVGDPAFSIGYRGADASRSRWLQFVWREIIAVDPARGPQPVHAVRSAKGGAHSYRLTTPPDVDSASRADPFYEAHYTDNRSADATTIYDAPGPVIEIVRDQFRAGATGVISRAHFTTYLVRDMRVLYAITTDLEWVFASAADDPRPTQTQSGRATNALDPEMRRKLAELYPGFAYLP